MYWAVQRMAWIRRLSTINWPRIRKDRRTTNVRRNILMVDYNLINSFGDLDAEVDAAVATALPDALMSDEGGRISLDLSKLVKADEVQDFVPGGILKGRISGLSGEDFVVELGLKSEGVLERSEFDEPDNVKVGDEVRVLLEDVEGDTGLVKISKRKADRIINWEAIMKTKKEGDPVSGKVTKKIKGGLLVDIGVPVFLPASQVDIRRPGEISDWIGRSIDAVILKIDEERRNIVISRRKLIEQQREELKRKTLDGLSIGSTIKGTVKNIADFGAFIDLGGIDGLLHITDMSWGRINHPSDILKIDQEIEVKVLQIDKDKEKIALGLKQKEASPWENIETRYSVGSVHEAEVVNIMSYGAFCKLEEGVEGLVHISEMSWTKRINHPSEVVSQGQKVQVKVLEINKDKQEISLGMKQVEENPWERVAEKYPPGSVVKGKVRNIANYGAVRRDRRGHRRPAPRQRFVLDQKDRASFRTTEEGRGSSGDGSQRRSGKTAHRAGPEADAGRSVDHRYPGQLSTRHGRSRARHQDRQLWRVCGTRARPRRFASHQRDFGPEDRQA